MKDQITPGSIRECQGMELEMFLLVEINWTLPLEYSLCDTGKNSIRWTHLNICLIIHVF